jgi:hypothetical protein
MSDPRRRRFKFNPSQVGSLPERPTVTRATMPEAKGVKRRHVLTAKPTGEIYWAPFNHLQDAATELAIKKAVATNGNWK